MIQKYDTLIFLLATVPGATPGTGNQSLPSNFGGGVTGKAVIG